MTSNRDSGGTKLSSIVEFTAVIRKLGINPCVNVPVQAVSVLLGEANKEHAPVQVKAAINGKGSFETNVVKYQGAHRLYLNTRMRLETEVGVGDTVHITLKYDPKHRMPPMPEALREALRKNKSAEDKWRMQSSSRRKEILACLNSLRSEESIRRQVEKLIRNLLE